MSRSGDGLLSQASVNLPESVKHKRYRQEFRTRFCEGLLSRRMLLAEGATEATAFPAVARRLKVLALSQTVTAFMHEYLLEIELVVEASRRPAMGFRGLLLRIAGSNLLGLCQGLAPAVCSSGSVHEHAESLCSSVCSTRVVVPLKSSLHAR